MKRAYEKERQKKRTKREKNMKAERKSVKMNEDKIEKKIF